MSEPVSARTWSAIVENESIGFDTIYEQIMLSLASLQANEKITTIEQEGEEIPPELRPVIEDPEEIIHLVLEDQQPPWWPHLLDRINIKVTLRPSGSTPEQLSPHPLDPNSRDLGKSHFLNILKNLFESAGTPFEGNIQVQIQRIRGKVHLGGFRGNVYVGEKLKKKKGGSDRDSEKDEMFELMLEEFRRSQDGMHRMFGNASNVIHASGAAINAMRGANAPPPWMNGEGGEEMPMWMHLAKGAMDMVIQANLGQPQSPAQVGMQMMQHPVQSPGALGAYGHQQPGHAPPQLPGPTAQDNLGYNQYMQPEGEYDGYYASEDDLIDDDFEDDEFYEDEEERYFEEEEEEEDDFEEESPPRRSARRSRSSGNPLDGMSPAELQAALSEYIDNNQDKKAELQQLGMGLANKILR